MSDEAPSDIIPSAAMSGDDPKRNLSVANAAAITAKVVECIASRIPPERIAKAIDKLLDAKRMTKFGPEEDPRAMEAGVKLYLSYIVGMPTQRIEQVNVNVDADTEAGMEERLKASPALRAKLQQMLDRTGAIEVPGA